VGEVVKKTVKWPTTTQSLKGILTAGPTNAYKYWQEKRAKGRELKTAAAAASASKVTKENE